jgi:hypothetical protein
MPASMRLVPLKTASNGCIASAGLGSELDTSSRSYMGWNQRAGTGGGLATFDNRDDLIFPDWVAVE